MFSKLFRGRVRVQKRAADPATDDQFETELAKLDALLAEEDEADVAKGVDDEDELDAIEKLLAEDAEDDEADVAKGKYMAKEDAEDEDLEDLLDEMDDEDAMPAKKPAKMKKSAAPADEVVALRKREVVLTKRLELLEKRERQRTLLQKAVTLVGEAPVAAEDVVKVLDRVLGDEPAMRAFASIMKKFQAVTEQSGLFTAVGSGEEAETAVTSELTKAAVALRKANSKLTPQQAIAKALEQHPELYEAYLSGDAVVDLESLDDTLDTE